MKHSLIIALLIVTASTAHAMDQEEQQNSAATYNRRGESLLIPLARPDGDDPHGLFEPLGVPTQNLLPQESRLDGGPTLWNMQSKEHTREVTFVGKLLKVCCPCCLKPQPNAE